MKSIVMKRFVVFSLVACLVAGTGLMAQEKAADPAKDPRKDYTEAERPEEGYLARFQAIDVSERLIKENLDQIYMLKVIASNFKDQGWEKDYQTIYDTYKKGVGHFYKRDVIYARVELEKNKKEIMDLYKKISEYYKQQVVQLLSDCADTILNLNLDEASRSDPNKNKVVFHNMMRLRIAYGQLDDGQNNFIDGLYANSVLHYRVAKSYGIRIMEDLDPEKSKGKFEVHKADNLNRILNPEAPKTTTPAK